GTLIERARALQQEAIATADARAATAKLREALDIWPRLPGLYDAYLRRKNAYTVLYVGVRALPEFLSPGLAQTHAERQAVDLLFEGLVRGTYDERLGQRFVPQLAAGAPEVLPRGRRLHLERTASWSNGERVTKEDVRDTVLLLKAKAGRAQVWADLYE